MDMFIFVYFFFFFFNDTATTEIYTLFPTRRSSDLWRHGHQLPPQPQADDAYTWHLANRNKRGIVLDLKSPSAQQVLEKLVRWADVLIVNTPHPARKKLKLEYDDVAQWNPRLIYADVTGFGEN